MPIFPLAFRVLIDEEGQVQIQVEDDKRIGAMHLWTLATYLEKIGDDLHRQDLMNVMASQAQRPPLVVATRPLPSRG